MPRQARVRAVLTLDNTQFVKSIKQSIAFAKDLAKQFAAAPIRTTFLAGILTARSGIKATASALQEMGKIAIDTMKVTAGATAAVAIALTTLGVKSSTAAAQVEDLTVAFRVLLKSEAAATARMKELVNFSAHTPYMLPQVAAASRTLEVLTQGMLSTGKGLTMVGDIASATNRDFEETAVTVGRLFAALRGGTNPGAELASLRDSGAITPGGANRITGMASVNPGKAWQIAQQELARFDGMMEQKSHTWNGLMSTFHDSVLNALAVFGKPLIDTLKPTLDQLTQTVFALAPKFQEMGTEFAKAIGLGVGVLEETFFHPQELIDPLGAGLKEVFLQAGNALIASVKLAANLLPNLGGSFKDMFVGVTQIISGELMKAFQGPIEFMQAGMEKAFAIWNVINNHKEASAAQAEVRVQEERLRHLKVSESGHTDAQFMGPNGEILGRIPASDVPGAIKETEGKLAMARAKASQFDTSETIASRQKRIHADNDVGSAANEQIAAGAQNMAKATQEALSAIEKAVSSFEVTDVTGAGDQMRAFMEALKRMAAKGKQDVDAVVRSQQQTAAMASAGVNSSGASGGLHGDLTSGGLITKTNATGLEGHVDWGGYHPGISPLGGFGGGPLSAGPSRTIQSLLPLSERKRNARQTRIAEIAQNFLRTGSFEEHRAGTQGLASSVRSGDRAAARQYIIGNQREAAEQGKLNAFKDAIKDSFDKSLDTQLSKYWGKGS